ncbi:hypothetical protein BGZ72_002837 [Mortierella alpina]|nr:hypothetical protein BGZ72_002837 [Mortierella alpina]
MHQKDPIQDWRSLKTPSPVSTRSTSHDYCWGDVHSKEYSKDGFPVITLTSPTNSESSIPIPVASTDTTGASSSTASTSSTRMPLPEQSAPGFFHDHALSKTASLKDMDETLAPVSEDKGSPTPSIYAADPRDLHLVRQSVPQHMLLHPSSSHNRIPRFEKQTPAPPSTSPPSLTDFPPTYEEAVDVLVVSNKSTDDSQGSSSNSNSSHSNNTNNTNNNGSCDEITSITPSAGSMDWASYRNRTEWNAEYGAEGEVDPLGSLSLSSSH